MRKYKINQINDKIMLKKGKYLCTDPCYVYDKGENRDNWSKFCNRLFKMDGRDGVVTRDEEGNEFLVIGTAHGDGSFPLYENNNLIANLSVDAGLLSVIPLKLAKKWSKFDENSRHWKVIELKEDAEFSSGGGNFEFGPFKVVTDGSDEEDETCPTCGCDCDCR